MRTTIAATLLVALSTSTAFAGIDWRNDIRAALDEAEERGVSLMIYLTRDD